MYDCLDPLRLDPASNPPVAQLGSPAVDFGPISRGGRGELYRSAQKDPLVRAVGIRNLFAMLTPSRDINDLSSEHRILDVLGGDGVLARAISQLALPGSAPSVLTSDVSEDMVAAARAYGLFALCQAAQNLFLKDDIMNGVIIAYGTHHIPRDQLVWACSEALRVLKPGSRIVLHDFEVNSPMSRWFGEVVDPYSLTGHNFPHFTRGEIEECLHKAGFVDITLQYMYDPFILTADSAEEAESLLAKYLLNMYGLVKPLDGGSYEEVLGRIYSLTLEYFKYDYEGMGLDESFGAPEVQVFKKDGCWHIEAPRVALVGCGVKPQI